MEGFKIICFYKHGEYLFKVYDQGYDWQCLCFKNGVKVSERWQTKHNGGSKESIFLSIKNAMESATGSRVIDIEGVIFV